MKFHVDARTQVVALYGHPVSHSLSPAMQNTAFNRLNINVIYISFNVTNKVLPQAMEAVRELGFLGLNLTHPHKRTVMGHLDRSQPELVVRLGMYGTWLTNVPGLVLFDDLGPFVDGYVEAGDPYDMAAAEQSGGGWLANLLFRR